MIRRTAKYQIRDFSCAGAYTTAVVEDRDLLPSVECISLSLIRCHRPDASLRVGNKCASTRATTSSFKPSSKSPARSPQGLSGERIMFDTVIVITSTVELAMPQTQSSVYISKSSFRLTYSLKMARGIFGADVLTSSNFQDFVCNV